MSLTLFRLCFLVVNVRYSIAAWANETCGDSFIDCGDGKCIDKHDYCYGIETCSNGTRSECSFKCQGYVYTCHNSQCLDRKSIECNGVRECSLKKIAFFDNDGHYEACPPILPDCGVFFSDDKSDIFPWHAGVWVESDEGIPIKICAATIIAPKYVLSAADCFWNFTTNSISPKQFTITAGLVNNAFKQNRPVKKVHLNGYHNTENETNVNNIAVVELTKSFSFNEDNVYPVCLFDYDVAKLNYIPVLSYVIDHFPEQMVSWTPGPNAHAQPRRLPFLRSINANPIINSEYKSEVANRASKYLRATSMCGPISDHGGGGSIIVRNRYFLKGVINPSIGNITAMSCLYRILTHVIPQLDFIRSVVDFQEEDNNSNGDIRDEADEFNKYVLNVILTPPKTLFSNCGKFDILDEKSPFPWYGAVWRGTELLCSHTVIRENLVITAASCFWNVDTDSLREDSYVATAGLKGNDFAQFRKVSHIIAQDYFNTETEEHINNIALVLLEEPFRFDHTVGAVCLYDVGSISTIPTPIEREGIMNSLYNCASVQDVGRQVMMEFVWNSRCFESLTSVPESYKLCMNIMSDEPLQSQCITPRDAGAGLFVVEGGLYFLRGVLNPRGGHNHLVFTNVLPYVNSIALLETELGDADLGEERSKIIIDGTQDLKRLFDITSDAKLNDTAMPLHFLFDLGGCEQKVEESCEAKDSCDTDGGVEFSCSRNTTSLVCYFAFCASGSICERSVYCNLPTSRR